MTLGLNWATLTNYATGPDTGTPTKVDPASATNGFIAGTVIAPQHVNFLINQIADQLADAVDGAGGGTYTLGSALRFQGADVEINAGLEILAAGELNVQSGGLVQVLTGGLIDIQGQAQVSSGGVLNVLSGGLLDVISGGTVEFNTTEDLKIDDATDAFRLTLAPGAIQISAGAPTWTPQFSGDTHAGVTSGWQQDDVSAPFTIAFPVNLPPGDEIVSVTALVNGSVTSGTGGHPAKPTGSDLPSLALVRVDGNGAATVVARRADQSADATAYSGQHTIVLTSGALDAGTLSHTVDANYAYFVVLKGETGANAVASEFGIHSVSGVCIARTYRANLMVY